MDSAASSRPPCARDDDDDDIMDGVPAALALELPSG